MSYNGKPKTMKIILPFLFLCCIQFNSYSQTKIEDINYSHAIPVYYSMISPIELKDLLGYKEVHTTYQWKKKTFHYINYYDEHGKLIRKKESRKKNDSLMITSEFKYDNLNQLINASLYYKKNKFRKYNYRYNESGKITELKITTSEKGNNTINSFWTYNSTGCLMEFVKTKSNGKDTNRRIIYEYYDSCKIARTIVYNGKGKIKSEWNYLCNQNGVKEGKKNEGVVCRWQEYSKDTLVEIYQTTDKKGNTRKNITKFNASDTLPLVRELYNHKNRLLIRWTYDKSYDKTTSYAWYKKNGKAKWSSESTYNNNQLTSTVHKKFDKVTGKSEFEYNSEGLILKSKRTKADGEIRWLFNYEYKK